MEELHYGEVVIPVFLILEADLLLFPRIRDLSDFFRRNICACGIAVYHHDVEFPGFKHSGILAKSFSYCQGSVGVVPVESDGRVGSILIIVVVKLVLIQCKRSVRSRIDPYS